jgi:hypothetical protein
MKIKNTFSKGKMNKSTDERLIPNGEYIDALNVRVLSTSASDAGAVENELGNEKITFLSESNNPVTIGSIADDANEKIYWFVVNDLGHSFVYEYDVKNSVTNIVLADTRTPNILAFNKNYKITGVNIVYNIHNDKNLLLFTDGLNQPRCINIERAKSYAENGFDEDDIILYKKPPRTAPSVQPYNTPDISENAVKERYFAFAYRYKYLDGEYSALSSFTNYQFVPGAFDIDYDTMENLGMVNIFNAYNLTYNSGDKRVTDIQICFKTTDSETVYIIDTINKEDQSIIDNVERKISFTNNKIYTALPQDEVFRIFDAIPLTAKAQEFIENRIVYGNVTDQYDITTSEGGDKIKVDYSASHYTLENIGENLTETISENEQSITVDFTGISFVKGYSLFVSAGLFSDVAGTAPNEYYGGTYNDAVGVILSETYLDLAAFLNSSDWTDFITSLNLGFAAAVETEEHPDQTSITYGTFALASSTSTSITLSAPVITYATPSGNQVEQYKWSSDTQFSLRESNSILSLKSNRQYEVGIVYLDKYGRYSSVIPTSKDSENRSSFSVPLSNSTDINRAEVKIDSVAPYWADRYKFFIKTNKADHYNIYATVFYQDGPYRWVLLTGNNANKVEPGTNLIVKSDSDGVISTEVKVKVLDVATKTALDIDTSSVNTDEGWLEGNEDPSGTPIKELYGVYMKIKPVGFTMNFDETQFSEYSNSGKINLQQSGSALTFLPDTRTAEGVKQGIAQTFDGTNYVNLLLRKGTQINFDFLSYEGNNRNRNEYKKNYRTSKDYTGDNNQSGLEKFLIDETSWYKPSGQDYYTNSADKFRITFTKSTVGSSIQHRMVIRSTETTALVETARIFAKLQIIINPESLYIFETDPSDVDSEVYYETEQTFDIVNGLHQGNIQNQTSSQSAICRLSVGNCFSFGNGAESISIKDARISPMFSLMTRPNIVLSDGYRRRKLESTLMYSGPINVSTSYNSLNEFNASRGISKLMDINYGSIQLIHSRDNDLIVFQEDKVQKVLYGKSLVYSSSGSASLTTIEDVLGQEIPFVGDYGISKNPESFTSYGGRMFFTDANRGTVLQLSNDGLTPISFYGMDDYFKSTLTLYRNSFNIGGYDPDSSHYVLSMNQAAIPQLTPRVPCSSKFTKRLASGETYRYIVDLDNTGDVTFDYVVSGNVDIDFDSESFSASNSNITGTGTLTYPIYPTDMVVKDRLIVDITANELSDVTIKHTCPVLNERLIDTTVLNDINLEGQTILNTYQVESGSEIGYTDVFKASGVARKESYVALVESDSAPADGDTVTMRSIAINGIHTAEFNGQSALGYLVSSTEKTTAEVVAQATYPPVTYTKLVDRTVNSISFTFNEVNPGDKLYMVWSYGFEGTVEVPEEGEDPVVPGGGCNDNIHTFYIGGGQSSLADLENNGPWAITESVNLENALLGSNLNTEVCKGGLVYTIPNTSYWIVSSTPVSNFDASNTIYEWIRIDTTGTIIDVGSGSGNPL